MFKEIFESLDGKSLESMGLTRSFLRKTGDVSTLDSDQLKMPFANQNKAIGFFATKSNPAYGYVIQEPTKEEQKEFGKDSYRIFGPKGTTIAKFNLQKGKVYFLDNDYYTNTDKVKYQSPINYVRFIIDDNSKAKRAFRPLGV